MLSEALLRRFDAPGPRYTSYPTADRFVEAFGAGDLCNALQQRTQGAVVGGTMPLSVYVHIPFCDSVCYYCACNKVITKHHERAAEYLDALETEIDLVVAQARAGQPVSQLHFGGGSPTFLSDAELQRVVGSLRRAFHIDECTEMSIEVDPRTVTPERLAHCRTLGFNRISFGVQDFDPQVQIAVHRVQPFDSVRELMLAARELGFKSINADLIYGLPRQTPQSFARTVQQIGELRPDRIALYAYAHLPQRFKPQRRIVADELPSAAQRVAMLGDAIAGFLGRGYHYIGMDHFALPDDCAGGGQAPGAAASQLPGLQHAARLRPDRPGRVVDRQGRGHLLPEREDAGRVLRRAAPGPAAGAARHRADARRRAAPRGDHGADVPGPAGVRIDRTGRT